MALTSVRGLFKTIMNRTTKSKMKFLPTILMKLRPLHLEGRRREKEEGEGGGRKRREKEEGEREGAAKTVEENSNTIL